MNPLSLNKDNNKCKWEIGIFILYLNHRNKRMFRSLAMFEKKFSFVCFHCAFCEMVVLVFFLEYYVSFSVKCLCLSFWFFDFWNYLFTICQCVLEFFILVVSDHRVDFICWSKLIMKGLKYFKLFFQLFFKKKIFLFYFYFNLMYIYFIIFRCFILFWKFNIQDWFRTNIHVVLFLVLDFIIWFI